MLYATYYEPKEFSWFTKYDGITIIRTQMKDNGDFRSNECINILKNSDIVITNPPFSLFGRLFDLLIENNKDFLLLGNLNALTYNNIFPVFMKGRVHIGYSTGAKTFDLPDGQSQKFGNIGWFTSLKVKYERTPIDNNCFVSANDYEMFDGSNIINIPKCKDIPSNYDGIMGVPFTFVNKIDYNQFEIIGMINHGKGCREDLLESKINGKPVFKRLAIRKVIK